MNLHFRTLPIIVVLWLFLSLNFYHVNANEFIPESIAGINFFKSSYEGGPDNNSGTTVYWAIIPKKYKPSIALAQNYENYGILEAPLDIATRNNATIAINSSIFKYSDDLRRYQIIGCYYTNGQLFGSDILHSGSTLYYRNDIKEFDSIINDTNIKTKITTINPLFATRGYLTIAKNGVLLDYDYRYTDYNTATFERNESTRNKKCQHTFIGQIEEKNGEDYISGDYFVGVCGGRNFDDNSPGLYFEEIYDFVRKYITKEIDINSTNYKLPSSDTSKRIKLLYKCDGGGSSAFIFNGERKNDMYEGKSTREREVADIIYWEITTDQENSTNYNHIISSTSKLIIDPNGGKIVVKSPAIERINQSITEKHAFIQTSGTYLSYDIPQKEETTNNTKYTLTYDCNGGNITPDKQIATQTIVMQYTFSGWTKDNTFKGTLDELSQTYQYPTENDITSTITANYTSTVKSNIISKLTLANAPFKNGYKFKGWKSSLDDKVYAAGTSFIPIDNVTMTAQWEKIKYNINGNYITNIYAGEIINDFIENLHFKNDNFLFVYKNNNISSPNEKVSTGMILKTETNSYKLVVIGDLNGDGDNTASDLARQMQIVTRSLKLDDVYYKAGDLNNDSKITAMDLARLQAILVGLYF